MAGLADQFRRNREAFTLALELGCMPKEAQEELRRREARERDQIAQQRLAEKMAAPSRILRDDNADEPSQPWMMRD